MTQPVLRTERLLIRPFREDDWQPLHPILSNPQAMRYWDNVHTDPAQTEAFVRGTIAEPRDRTCDFILERDGRLVGKAGMWRKPEIGFILDPEHWRQGLMREALGVIIPHLFTAYEIPALTTDVDPENAASLGILNGLGFVETGRARNTIQIAGRWCDSVYLALSREDWMARSE